VVVIEKNTPQQEPDILERFRKSSVYNLLSPKDRKALEDAVIAGDTETMHDLQIMLDESDSYKRDVDQFVRSVSEIMFKDSIDEILRTAESDAKRREKLAEIKRREDADRRKESSASPIL
jgi:hypothetical protein